MRTLVSILLLFLFALTASGQARQPQTPSEALDYLASKAMTKEQFASYLGSVRVALPIWKAAVSRIDVTALHLINYEEGKTIDEEKAVCLQQIELISREVSDLSKKQSLSGLVSLLASMDDFRESLTSLRSSIAMRPFPEITAKDYPQTGAWSESLFATGNECGSLRERLREHLISVAAAVDAVLNG